MEQGRCCQSQQEANHGQEEGLRQVKVRCAHGLESLQPHFCPCFPPSHLTLLYRLVECAHGTVPHALETLDAPPSTHPRKRVPILSDGAHRTPCNHGAPVVLRTSVRVHPYHAHTPIAPHIYTFACFTKNPTKHFARAPFLEVYVAPCFSPPCRAGSMRA